MRRRRSEASFRFYLLAVSMTLCAVVALGALAATAALAYLQHLLPEASAALVIVGKIVGYSLLDACGRGDCLDALSVRPVARGRAVEVDHARLAVRRGDLAAADLGVRHLRRRFTNYHASYGSLGAVVALLTWMYLSAYAFIFGAELNSEIEHQTAKDSTTGSPEPMGERGAWAADNVATDDTVQDRPEEEREGEKLTQAAPKIAEEKG